MNTYHPVWKPCLIKWPRKGRMEAQISIARLDSNTLELTVMDDDGSKVKVEMAAETLLTLAGFVFGRPQP